LKKNDFYFSKGIVGQIGGVGILMLREVTTPIIINIGGGGWVSKIIPLLSSF